MWQRMKTQATPPKYQQTTGQDFSSGDLIVEAGLLFLGAPYRENTLDGPGRERLIVDLRAFDCTTFVETVLALVRSASSGKFRAAEFRRNLQRIRYRGEKSTATLPAFTTLRTGLPTIRKKVLRDVSRILGGVHARKKIDFMTAHRERYASLKRESQAKKMRQTERRLSRRPFYMIGKERASQIQNGIQPGDIIAFTTSQEGLDVAHVGFAIRERGRLRLLHASSREGAVAITAGTLPAYLKSRSNFTGILVARMI